jgi:hypothetical protein
LADGAVTFDNVASRIAGEPPPDGGYRAEWFTFDNTSGATRPIGPPAVSTTESLPAPPDLPAATGTLVKVAITAPDSHHPAWSQPVDVYFRRSSAGWTLVGVDRRLPPTS